MFSVSCNEHSNQSIRNNGGSGVYALGNVDHLDWRRRRGEGLGLPVPVIDSIACTAGQIEFELRSKYDRHTGSGACAVYRVP